MPLHTAYGLLYPCEDTAKWEVTNTISPLEFQVIFGNQMRCTVKIPGLSIVEYKNTHEDLFCRGLYSSHHQPPLMIAEGIGFNAYNLFILREHSHEFDFFQDTSVQVGTHFFSREVPPYVELLFAVTSERTGRVIHLYSYIFSSYTHNCSLPTN